MNLRVSGPDQKYGAAFLRMLEDYEANDPVSGKQFSQARIDFAAYAQQLSDEERGDALPDGYVPCSQRWLLEGEDIVGIVRVRHSIDHPLLAREGGHIGYDVPPSRRGRGLGTTVLRVGLERARELGLSRVLVCSDAKNAASCSIIERCDGVLEEEFYSEAFGCLVRRYWIELSPEQGSAAPRPTGS